jgi:hypothetical protein
MQCYSKSVNPRVIVFMPVIIFMFFRCTEQKMIAQPWTDVFGFRYTSLPFSEKEPQRLTWLHTDAAYGIKFGSMAFALNPSFEKSEGSWGQAVYGISMPLIYSLTWPDTAWKSVFIAIARLNSDLKSISGDDYQAGGVNIHSVQRKANLKYKFGFYANTEYDKLFVIPLAGIEWKCSKRFLVNALLPSYLISEFKLFPFKIHTGLLFRSYKKSFRFKDGSYLSMHDNYAALFTDFYFARAVVLNVEGGYAFMRKYKLGTGFPENTEQRLKVKEGLMFRLAMIYRIRSD